MNTLTYASYLDWRELFPHTPIDVTTVVVKDTFASALNIKYKIQNTSVIYFKYKTKILCMYFKYVFEILVFHMLHCIGSRFRSGSSFGCVC